MNEQSNSMELYENFNKIWYIISAGSERDDLHTLHVKLLNENIWSLEGIVKERQRNERTQEWGES